MQREVQGKASLRELPDKYETLKKDEPDEDKVFRDEDKLSNKSATPGERVTAPSELGNVLRLTDTAPREREVPGTKGKGISAKFWTQE